MILFGSPGHASTIFNVSNGIKPLWHKQSALLAKENPPKVLGILLKTCKT
jgi:hypothetical protein